MDSLCHALVEQVRHPVDRALVMTLANLLRLEVLDELDRRENPRIYAALESGGGC